jgi:hypothetical protein
MTEPSSFGREAAKGAGIVIGHLAAVVLGVVLMILGSALGVTLVLLPVGIPVGLVGLGFFLWGMFGWANTQSSPKNPPAP